MSNLIVMGGQKGDGVKESLERAMKHVDECDGVVIIMQKRTNGMLWFAPDSMRAETTMFYCQMLLSHVVAMLRGE